jgi:hypothetical protein
MGCNLILGYRQYCEWSLETDVGIFERIPENFFLEIKLHWYVEVLTYLPYLLWLHWRKVLLYSTKMRKLAVPDDDCRDFRKSSGSFLPEVTQ